MYYYFGNLLLIISKLSGLSSKEVFNFQNPGPLQLSLISSNFSTIEECSVLIDTQY